MNLGIIIMKQARPRIIDEIVYILLELVPPGYTVTYGTLAKLTGTTPRAIGAYMRKNKKPIVIPCHRVVAAKGLGGYSLGTSFKVKLLLLEGALTPKGLRVIRDVNEYWRIVEKEGYDITDRIDFD